MAYLAPKYPDTLWFHLTGDLNVSLPNWGLGSAKIHQTIFLAGMVAGRETKTGRVGACMQVRIPETYSHLAAFALGVAYVNASVKVVASWSESWLAPERDVFMVQRMVANGMDIIFHRCGSLESINEAAALGARSIGFNSEFAMLVGETLLLSPFYNWGVVILQVACLVVDGKYKSSLPVDLFPGLESNAVGLSDPSYLVHKTIMAEVQATKAELQNHTNDTFCGPTLTNAGTIVGQAGSCLTLHDLRVFDWEPWNVVDDGHYALPSEACHPGERSEWDTAAEKYTCSACPASTYSQLIANLTYQAYICLPCPSDTFSTSNSTGCSTCPPGTSVHVGQDRCVPIPMATSVLVGIIVGALVGGVCLVGSAYGVWYAWRATADLRKLRQQFSNNNVAQECAEAIACFNLESVAWLRTCKNPNKIQLAFLQILEMMTMVQPYIPDHVLCLFTQRQRRVGALGSVPNSPAALEKGPEAGEAHEAIRRTFSDVSSAVHQVPGISPQNHLRDRPPQYVQVSSRGSWESNGSALPRPRKPGTSYGPDARSPRRSTHVLPSAGEWLAKRCTYVVVGISFAASEFEEEDEEEMLHHTSHLLTEVVGIAKTFSATIDHVTCNKVALHWGLVNSVSEGALKATLAALEMVRIRSRLPSPWRTLLRLTISIVQGICHVTSISAAGHSFFVVGGSLLRQISSLVRKDLAGKCQCEILISASVQQQAQYAVECMPRCFLGSVLFWQPLRQFGMSGAQSDEWMYELHHMEADQVDKWCSRSLHNAFQAARSQDPKALQLQVERLREQFKSQMSPQDEACLDLLLATCGGSGGMCGL
eukprot:GGOE01012231.1.p1 GENE.GGOE01012231.1~~GGOE01012231.1.p1  ORF type:complete len:935 (-),score=235.85 GGOE01012231.1:381-2843(-)